MVKKSSRSGMILREPVPPRYQEEEGFTLATIVFVIQENRVLLGLKSRGRFGEKRWNGPGGKAERRETMHACAKREVRQETGVELLDPLKEVGVLFSVHPRVRMRVHIFVAERFQGIPRPSKELERVEWFDLEDLPLNDFWEDQQFWMQLAIAGKSFTAFAKYGKQDNEDRLVKWDVILGPPQTRLPDLFQ